MWVYTVWMELHGHTCLGLFQHNWWNSQWSWWLMDEQEQVLEQVVTTYISQSLLLWNCGCTLFESYNCGCTCLGHMDVDIYLFFFKTGISLPVWDIELLAHFFTSDYYGYNCLGQRVVSVFVWVRYMCSPLWSWGVWLFGPCTYTHYQVNQEIWMYLFGTVYHRYCISILASELLLY